MSQGKLDLQLDVYPELLVTPYTEDNYVEWLENFGSVIKSLIDTVDRTVDFTAYDNWDTANRMYRTQEGPDGKVDLLIVVFRSVARTEFLPYSGVSDLGFYGLKFVDSGISRYVYGGSGAANDAGASGVTICRAPGWRVVTDYDYAFRVALHELGHKFLGEGHTNELYGGLGLMANAGNGHAMNSFERQLAGYTSFSMLTPGVDTTITLHDYVTTGEACLLPVAELARSYYSFEFRDGKSEWDDAPVPGVYIYRIYDSWGQNQKSIQVISAEGSFQWGVDSTGKACKLKPDALFGYNRFQRIPINGKNYWADGWWGDPRCAFTLDRPDFRALKNPSPDFIFGQDTIRTNLNIRVTALAADSAQVSISYQSPVILGTVSALPDGSSVGQLYPHPIFSGSNAFLPVRFERSQHCRISIHDMLGRVLENAYEGTLGPGTHTLSIPTSGLGPGSYFLVTETGTGRQTRPFIISK